jgi:hypothetical protein
MGFTEEVGTTRGGGIVKKVKNEGLKGGEVLKVQFSIPLDENLWFRFKTECYRRRLKMSYVVKKLITEWTEKKEKENIKRADSSSEGADKLFLEQ